MERKFAFMDAKNVGERISSLRKEQGITQKELADKLCITNKAVSKWETGDGFPDITILPELAKALNTSVDFLLANRTANYLARNKLAMRKSMAIQLLVLAIAILFVFWLEEILVHYLDPATFIFTLGGSVAGAFLMKKLKKMPDLWGSFVTYGFPIGCITGEIYTIASSVYSDQFMFWFFIMPILYSTLMMVFVYILMRWRGLGLADTSRRKAGIVDGDAVSKGNAEKNSL